MSNYVAITRLSSRGQIVIPKEVRESLAWEAGDYVAVEVQGDKVVLRRLVLEEAAAGCSSRSKSVKSSWAESRIT